MLSGFALLTLGDNGDMMRTNVGENVMRKLTVNNGGIICVRKL